MADGKKQEGIFGDDTTQQKRIAIALEKQFPVLQRIAVALEKTESAIGEGRDVLNEMLDAIRQLNTDDPQKLAELTAKLKEQADKLQAAIDANTPKS